MGGGGEITSFQTFCNKNQDKKIKPNNPVHNPILIIDQWQHKSIRCFHAAKRIRKQHERCALLRRRPITARDAGKGGVTPDTTKTTTKKKNDHRQKASVIGSTNLMALEEVKDALGHVCLNSRLTHKHTWKTLNSKLPNRCDFNKIEKETHARTLVFHLKGTFEQNKAEKVQPKSMIAWNYSTSFQRTPPLSSHLRDHATLGRK